MKKEKEFYEKLENHLKTDGIEFENKGEKSKKFKMDLYQKVKYELETIFNLEIEDKYFNEVCNGTGEEIAKIDSIWSSSLLSFLVFYSSIKNGGIDIEVDNKDVHFNEVYFEFLNPTFEKYPKTTIKQVSNMDCVLLSEDKKIILFIESKFKEYITDVSKKDKLSESYKNDIFTKEIYEEYKKIVNDNSKEMHYLDGLKQLITHFSGLQNFNRNVFHNDYISNSTGRKNDIINAKKKGAKFYFMEVIYDLTNIGDETNIRYEKEVKDYKDISKKLEDEMKKKINVLPLITYQELLYYKNNKDRVGKRIKDYYKFL